MDWEEEQNNMLKLVRKIENMMEMEIIQKRIRKRKMMKLKERREIWKMENWKMEIVSRRKDKVLILIYC